MLYPDSIRFDGHRCIGEIGVWREAEDVPGLCAHFHVPVNEGQRPIQRRDTPHGGAQGARQCAL
jgi:hypothetical protein